MATRKKAAPQIETSIEKLTYAEVKELIDKQAHNRPVRKADVKRLAKQFFDKTYVTNGESIIIDSRGKLMDGQHRCYAFVMAVEEMGLPEDSSFETVVVRGVHRKHFATIDQGNKRSLADVVDMDDHPNAKDLAVALRLLKIRLSGGKVRSTGKLPPYEMLELLEQHKGLSTSVEIICTIGSVESELEGEGEDYIPIKSLISIGYASALHYLSVQSYGQEKTDDFFFKLCNLDHTDKGCPAFALRKLLQKNAQTKEHKLQRDALVDYTIKAINAYMAGESMSSMGKLRKGEAHYLGGFDLEPEEE